AGGGPGRSPSRPGTLARRHTDRSAAGRWRRSRSRSLVEAGVHADGAQAVAVDLIAVIALRGLALVDAARERPALAVAHAGVHAVAGALAAAGALAHARAVALAQLRLVAGGRGGTAARSSCAARDGAGGVGRLQLLRRRRRDVAEAVARHHGVEEAGQIALAPAELVVPGVDERVVAG